VDRIGTGSRATFCMAALVSAVAFVLSACGQDAKSADPTKALEGRVVHAMETVPYEYRMMKSHNGDGYVIFRARDPESSTSVDIAFGRPQVRKGCGLPPSFAGEQFKRVKPIEAARRSPAICLAIGIEVADGSEFQNVALGRMIAAIGEALCIDVAGGFNCSG
jgi:hypothetical protein